MTHATSQPEPAAALPLFVGIDVAKDKLDLARSDAAGKILTVANDPGGISHLVRSLRTAAAAPTTVVIEATGGLEQPLLDALLDADLPVALVNPGKVRHFAQGMGILAKTDAIDARVLVEFARHAAPRLAAKRSANQLELQALVTCRRQLAHAQTEHKNRRATTRSKAARKSIDAVLDALAEQVRSLNEQIAQLIASDDDLDDRDRLLRTAPGVGPVLSATLVAQLDELGKADRQHIGALVGVAPFNNDSGPRTGKRAIRGGRADVRGVLYMATVAAIRCNPVIKAFADRMRAAGKAAKVTIVACMRKLLSLLNAMIREHLTWDQLNVAKNLSHP